MHSARSLGGVLSFGAALCADHMRTVVGPNADLQSLGWLVLVALPANGGVATFQRISLVDGKPTLLH